MFPNILQLKMYKFTDLILFPWDGPKKKVLAILVTIRDPDLWLPVQYSVDLVLS